jgi:hypothetical protein
MHYENNVRCPEHYSQVAAELSGLNRTIARGLLHRPRPAGHPWRLPEEISRLFENMLDLTDALRGELQCFSRIILVADFLPADADVGQAFEKVSAPVENLLELHHVLWRRPFPDGFEAGQYLLSAIMERPLRSMFELFEKALAVIDNPEKARDREGSETISLSLNLEADREVHAFLRWCDTFSLARLQRKKGNLRIDKALRQEADWQDNSWFEMVVAFLFGRFFKKDNS